MKTYFIKSLKNIKIIEAFKKRDVQNVINYNFLNGKLGTILKLRNVEIGPHLIFAIIKKIDLLLISIGVV